MKLIDFLLYKTHAEELCIICVNGWRTAAVWIDHEDLFTRYVHHDLWNLPVIRDEWESLETCNNELSRVYVMAHYIYVEV